MKKNILFLVLFLVLSSCQLSKKLLTTDNSKKTTITDRREITRKGDSLSIILPNIRYRDTTIVKYNYETKTLARVTYDSQGNQQFDCVSAEIKLKLEQIREELKKDVKTKKETSSKFTPQHFIIALAVLVLLVIIALIFIYVMMTRFQKNILNLKP